MASCSGSTFRNLSSSVAFKRMLPNHVGWVVLVWAGKCNDEAVLSPDQTPWEDLAKGGSSLHCKTWGSRARVTSWLHHPWPVHAWANPGLSGLSLHNLQNAYVRALPGRAVVRIRSLSICKALTTGPGLYWVSALLYRLKDTVHFKASRMAHSQWAGVASAAHSHHASGPPASFLVQPVKAPEWELPVFCIKSVCIIQVIDIKFLIKC